MTWQLGLTMGIGCTILTVLGFGLAIFLYTRIKERNEEEEKAEKEFKKIKGE